MMYCGVKSPPGPALVSPILACPATITYSTLLAAGSIALATQSDARRAVWLRWTSTNLDNLQHHPLPALIGSAFLPEDHALAWIALAVLGLAGTELRLGPLRTATLAVLGHLLGTTVSEGLLAVRVHTGDLPASARQIIDVGPSFVVVTGLLAALVVGRAPARVAPGAAVALLALGGLFTGLTQGDVAAVGHVGALVTGAVGGWALKRRPAG
jgi:hypothetical protein